MSLTARVLIATGLVVALALAVVIYVRRDAPSSAWSADERAALAALWIGALGPVPPDPSNAFANDPRAAELGRMLFFDRRLSANGEVACATCHVPDKGLQDGLRLAEGVATGSRRTMPLAGAAYSPWFFWDGRADSQWAQALGPLESSTEHGGTRTAYAHLIARHYRAEYEAIFGPLPDLDDEQRFPAAAGPLGSASERAAWTGMLPEDQTAVNRIFANIGKAVAAYGRLLTLGPSRFDAYVEALLAGKSGASSELLTEDEAAGLRLFIGIGNCVSCHNGPLFTNNAFHNTGVPPDPELLPDSGRALGVEQLLADEFNCLGPYSDADPNACAELRFVVSDDARLEGAFKTPSLRNVAERAPYMHAGQIASLDAVLEHYNAALPGVIGHNELEPLHLSDAELRQLAAFLAALSGPLATPPDLLHAPPGPSGSLSHPASGTPLLRRRRAQRGRRTLG